MNHPMNLTPQFSLGALCITPGAMDALNAAGASPAALLYRHVAGDWGDVDSRDAAINNSAIAEGDRLLSAYNLDGGARVWIITEADRSSTTILLPEDY